MRIDPDTYDYRNLKDEDKALIDAIEETKQTVLNASVIEDFIDSKEIMGATLQGIYRDALKEFVVFLQERTEYHKVDLIIEKIDGYTEEEFQALYEKSHQKITANAVK